MRTALLTLLIVAWATLPAQANTACCLGPTGNLDCDPNNITDITDLTVFIDHLFIGLAPLCCVESGNIDGDPGHVVDITDLTVLIDYLFISLNPTAACLILATIAVVPDSGMPGNIVTVTGMVGDTAKLDQYAVTIGAELAPFRVLPDGSFEVVLPLYLDSNLWPSPPAGAQSIEISLNGALIGEAVNALTILPLPRATGTTQEILAAGESFITAMTRLDSLLPVTDSVEIPVRQAGIAALTALLSHGDSSLTAILDGSSSLMTGVTPNFELTDALLASSGVKDYFLRLTGGFNSLVDSAINARSTSIPILCRSGGPDMDLACKMQVYEVARDWRIQVLNEVQQGFDNITSLNGLIGLSGKSVPHVALVSAVLYVMEMLYDRNLLALLPSQVTAFELAIVSDTIEVDEYTSSTMVVRATNQPVTLTLQDVITDALALLPLGGSNEFVQTFREFLLGVASFSLNKYRDILLASGSFGDIQLGQTPLIPFIAPVTNPDLVVLFSGDESIIIGDETAFEWRGVSRGLGRVEGRSRGSGIRSKVLNDHALCFGCVYSGAAFGNSAPSTGLVSVPVGHKYDLELSITGLPTGVDGDVGVAWPDGNFTAHTATATIKGLDPGDYSITALPVTDLDGKEYVPDPDAQTVTVVAGTGNTATVDYLPKYGNLLLTIPGLPAGSNADIDITGPNGFNKHVVAEGLIDSLLKGDYMVTAHPITDAGKTLNPDPVSQTVTIVGGQTSLAAVEYLGGLQISVFYGPGPKLGHVQTSVLEHNILVENYNDDVFDGYDSTKFEVTNCAVTGRTFSSAGGSAGNGVSYGSANASGSISVDASGFTLSTSSFATVSLPSSNSPSLIGSASANLAFGSTGSLTGSNRGVVVDIVNPAQDTIDIVVTWGVTATQSGGTPDFNVGGGSASITASFPFNSCGYLFNGNDTLFTQCNATIPNPPIPCSGTHTFTTTATHSQAAFGAASSATVNLGQSTVLPSSGTIQTDVTLVVAVRKR